MRKAFKYLFFASVAALFLTNAVPAAALPPLPRDARVQEDTLQSGVCCYLVKNPVAIGYADVAVAAREGGRPHVFADVPVYRTQVLDSVLVRAFGLLRESGGPQAIVVSGDIDPVEIKKKLDLLSILVPYRSRGSLDAGAQWKGPFLPQVRLLSSAPGELSRVQVCYQAVPVPLEQRNTAQALVTDIFSRELQVIVRHRLEKELAREGIPVAELEVSYEGYGGPAESLQVTVSCREANLDRVTALISSVLSRLDTEGISRPELEDARAVMNPAMQREVSAPESNALWLRRCIRHYRYGTHLAPFSEEFRLFGRKALEGDVYVGLLNNYSSALFDYADNLLLRQWTSRDTLDHGSALFDYIGQYLETSLEGPSGVDYSWHSADTLALEASAPRVTVKSQRAEPVSGGSIWTFSNGIRVIYKPVKGQGSFSYALLLGGGLAQISGLKEGEGGYIGPLLSLYDVAGMPAARFRDMIAANGITLEAVPQLHALSLEGSAPSDKLVLLLKSLLALSTQSQLSPDAFKAYRAQQSLRGNAPLDALYHILNPGFAYSPYPKVSALTDKTRQKAEKYYQERLSHMGDATLILCGDLPEEGTRRLLQKYLGAFPAAPSAVNRRSVGMRTISGVSSRVKEDAGAPFYVLMDTDYAMTAAHYYTAHLAADALRTALKRHLAPYGYAAAVEVRCCVQPQEHFQLLVSCTPVEEGVSAERALSAVRAAIREAAAVAPAQLDLEAWKKKLQVSAERHLSTAEGLLSTLVTRYALNKDITSHYSEAIASVQEAQVQEFLQKAAAGGRVEYLLP